MRWRRRNERSCKGLGRGHQVHDAVRPSAIACTRSKCRACPNRLADRSGCARERRAHRDDGWEVHDAAVQVVRDHLTKAGKKLMSWTGDPRIDPAIWFVGDSGPEWVIARVVRYPALIASPPADWARIAECCASHGKVGYFASVSLASAEDAFDPDHIIPPVPLWRGHAMVVRFEGLVRGPVQTSGVPLASKACLD